MNASLYIATNMNVKFPADPVYKPIFCGESSQTAPNGCLTDATGDNISYKNTLYCELTALYWAWKNDAVSDYIGLCHYRRYMIMDTEAYNQGIRDFNLLTATTKLTDYLRNCDIILTTKSHNAATQYSSYATYHRESDLQTCIQVIEERHPAYRDALWQVLNGHDLYACQMFITSRRHFHNYMSWLFDILTETEKRIYLPYDHAKQRRALAFLGERLLTVYVLHNRLQIRELPMLFLNNAVYDKSSAPVRGNKDVLLRIIAAAGKKNLVFAGDTFYRDKILAVLSLPETEYITLNDENGVIVMDKLRPLLQPNVTVFLCTVVYAPIKDWLLGAGYKENVDFVNGNEIVEYLRE